MNNQRAEYFENNFQRFIDDLSELTAIPSISSLPEYKAEVERAAKWLQGYLAKLGFSAPEVIATAGHPLVYAQWQVDPNLPTVLIYGHYDVQPVDPIDEWHQDPFSPVLKDGWLWGRGASDDKGQIMLVLAALDALISEAGSPPVNIKILLEGEEEAGGEAIAEYVQLQAKRLQADAVLICDTAMPDPQTPTLVNSLRGILYTELLVQGPKRDLHSGAYGGIAPNPIHALCLLLSRLKGEDGQINIPQLQAATPTAGEEELSQWRQESPAVESALLQEMGTGGAVGENHLSFMERVGLRPTLEVHGIKGGFTGDGAKTVIPAKATAKLSLRLSPDMDPEKVFTWLEEAVATHLPTGYQHRLTNLHGGRGVEVDTGSPAIKAAADALQHYYSKAPIYIRMGGSIPVASLFSSELKAPVVLMGFALPDDCIHSPNERFSLGQYRAGMTVVADFLSRLAAL